MVIGAATYVGQDALAQLLPASRVPRAALSLLSLAIFTVIAFSQLAKNWNLTYLAMGPLVERPALAWKTRLDDPLSAPVESAPAMLK